MARYQALRPVSLEAGRHFLYEVCNPHVLLCGVGCCCVGCYCMDWRGGIVAAVPSFYPGLVDQYD